MKYMNLIDNFVMEMKLDECRCSLINLMNLAFSRLYYHYGFVDKLCFFLLTPRYINELKLCFVLLFHEISSNLGILCFHDGNIINTDNDIAYNGGSHEFLTATLDMSFNELSRMLYDQFVCNMFEI
jgi:hypothetical protein